MNATVFGTTSGTDSRCTCVLSGQVTGIASASGIAWIPRPGDDEKSKLEVEKSGPGDSAREDRREEAILGEVLSPEDERRMALPRVSLRGSGEVIIASGSSLTSAVADSANGEFFLEDGAVDPSSTGERGLASLSDRNVGLRDSDEELAVDGAGSKGAKVG